MSKRSDLVPLGDMYDAALETRDLVRDVSKDVFLASRTLQLSIVHLLQIIGEAARRVSVEIKTTHADIPWQDIMGMRHKIVHDYTRIDLNEVWRTATEDVPTLIDALSKFMPSDPP